MKKIFLTIALVAGMMVSAQVKIGDQVTILNPNSLLELQSTDKGVLFPRVALTGTTSFAPLSAHVAGMTVYNTATAGDVTAGMYTNDGAKWVKLGAAVSTYSVVSNTSSTYTILGTEDVILSNSNSASSMALPASATVGKRIVIANNTGSGGAISITVTSPGSLWLGSGGAVAQGNVNVYTYTGVNGWIAEVVGLN